MPPQMSPAGAPKTSRLKATQQPTTPAPEPLPRFNVAIIITCHNYAHYLANAIESARGQSTPPSEIIVINDDSSDNTVDVAALYDVRVETVRFRNLLKSRLHGLKLTTAPIVCFLDADDMLAGDYLEKGTPLFHDPAVGVAWSDMLEFGYAHSLRTMNQRALTQQNFAHSGSLVRRAAIELTDINHIDCPNSRSEDWLMWRLIERDGWTFKKNPAIYHYRRHRDSMSHTVNSRIWQEVAPIPFEKITLTIPLSGRHNCWPQMKQWLDNQTLDKSRISLILLSSSSDHSFNEQVRLWAANSKYPDVRFMHNPLPVPDGVADLNRRNGEVRLHVQNAVARIYRTIAKQATHDYIWIVEDDVIPPLNAGQLLLDQFDEHIMSVSGCYPSPYYDALVAWHAYATPVTSPPEKPITIAGNGFGCLIIRKEVLNQFGIQNLSPTGDYDVNLYLNAAKSHWKAILHPQVNCQHLHIENR